MGALAPMGRMVRVESPLEPGLPDLAWCLRLGLSEAVSGWMELKHLPAWPSRPGTPVRLPHEDRLRLQALWASRWEAAGGRSPLLLQVGRDYLLFPGARIAELFLDTPRPRVALLRAALAVGEGAFPRAALAVALAGKRYGRALIEVSGV